MAKDDKDKKAAAKKAAEKKLKAKAAKKAKELAAAKKAKEKAAAKKAAAKAAAAKKAKAKSDAKRAAAKKADKRLVGAKKATLTAAASRAVVESLPVTSTPVPTALAAEPDAVEAVVAPAGPTRRQLLVTAGELGIVGRHRMSKEQLEAAVAAH